MFCLPPSSAQGLVALEGRENVTKIADPMAVPLIVINTLIIVYALVLG